MSPTLIFLHGGPGFRDYLKPYFSSLDEYFRCVFFDQVRGDSIKIEDQLTQLDQIIKSENNQVVLIGHSWGGVLATAFASHCPEKLAGLVLISTGLKASHWKDEFRNELKNLNLEDATPEQIFLTSEELETGRALLDSAWIEFSVETFDSLNSTYLQDYDLTGTLSNLTIPILNIFGQNDVRFPKRVTKSFSKNNSRVIDLEILGAGHFPFLLESNRKKITENIHRLFLSASVG